MVRLALWIDQLNEKVGRAVSWLTLFLMLITTLDVLFRYAFSLTAAWVTELEWHLFALIFLLGAGYTLKHDQHVRVDVFYSRFNPRTKAWVNIFGVLFLLVPLCIFVLRSSFRVAYISFQRGEGSSEDYGLPALYLIKFAITLCFFFLFLQGISLLIHSIQQLRSRPNSSPT